jgi:hypothetical protein
MKLVQYTSVAAFLAHWRALRHAADTSAKCDETAIRAEMDKVIAALRPEERAALETSREDSQSAGARAIQRRRERAEIDLARELRARGMLQD